jgi:hypothetical protein
MFPSEFAMLKKILIGIVVVIAAFAIFIAAQPSHFTISRTGTIDAPPAIAFAQVNSFRKWDAWSPWAKQDPNAVVSFDGPDAGKGAKFTWKGNGDIGAGSMTITESQPYEKILIDLTFTEPMEGTNLTEFTFTPKTASGEQTEVTWTMSGENNFIGRAICTFMSMEHMVGDKFEAGLAAMNEAAKKDAAAK